MTETEFDCDLATYTREPSGLTATPYGALPTGIVAMTLALALSMTLRLLPDCALT